MACSVSLLFATKEPKHEFGILTEARSASHMVCALTSITQELNAALFYFPEELLEPMTSVKEINHHTAVCIVSFLKSFSGICHMEKLHVVMLSYNHHRHTSKATVYGRSQSSRGRKQELSGYICTATQTRQKQIYKTLHANQKSLTNPFYATAGIVAYMHIDPQTPSNFQGD